MSSASYLADRLWDIRLYQTEITMSIALLIAIGYGLIAYVLVRDINRARKVYNFNYVRLGRWTVRRPNGRFMRNLANVWDIATLGSKL